MCGGNSRTCRPKLSGTCAHQALRHERREDDACFKLVQSQLYFGRDDAKESMLFSLGQKQPESGGAILVARWPQKEDWSQLATGSSVFASVVSQSRMSEVRVRMNKQLGVPSGSAERWGRNAPERTGRSRLGFGSKCGCSDFEFGI